MNRAARASRADVVPATDAAPPSRAVAVSVIIPVRDGAEVILEQLEAIDAQIHPGDVEIVVADNGSADGTPDLVERWAAGRPDVRLIVADAVAGPAHARNCGAARARGEVLLFADADDRVLPGWMTAMCTALEHHELVGAVRTSSHAPAASVPAVPPRFAFLPWAGGGNLGVRRPVFQAAGGFDEQLRFGEDVELCWRLQVGGSAMGVVPAARVWHRERARLREVFTQSWRFGRAAHGLYRRFEADGARWPGWRRELRTGAWLLVELPAAVVSAPARRRWTGRIGGLLGRLAGSLSAVWSATSGRHGPRSA